MSIMSVTIGILVILAALLGVSIGLLIKRKDNTPDHLDAMLADINRQQSEMTGRLNSFAEMQEAAKGEINRTLSERLESVSKNVTHTLQESREKTTKTLSELGERLSLIDQAQQQITALSGQVVELQHILDNKQARGAFGEAFAIINIHLASISLNEDGFMLFHEFRLDSLDVLGKRLGGDFELGCHISI